MRRALAACALLCLSAPIAGADPRPAPLRIENTGEADLACRITIAHWYLLEFGPVAPGQRIELPLRYDTDSQTVSVLNAPGDEMAVERLTCGPADQVWALGADLPFRSLAARAEQGAVACQAGPPLDCATQGS